MLASVLALSCFATLHLKGIGLNPDGWTYWEGAASLLAGRGYRYFTGEPIVFWPPLYSLYLAAWSRVAGPSALSIILANGFLVGLQAALWCWTSLVIWSESGGGAPSPFAVAAVVLYLGLAIPVAEQSVMADVLKYSLLPLVIFTGWRTRSAPHSSAMRRWLAWNTIAATALLLVHNDAVAFVLANGVLLLAGRDRKPARAIAALAATMVPVAVWAIVRYALGQAGSHPVTLGGARYGPATYLVQLFRGIGALIVPDRFGAAFLAISALMMLTLILVWRRRVSAVAFLTGFVGIAIAATYVLFNVVWIDNPLAGRFVLFVALALIPTLFLAAADWNRAVFAAVVVVALCPQIYWTAAWYVRRNHSPLAENGYPNGFVTPGVRLSVDYREGPPVSTSRGTVVSPKSWHPESR